MPSTRHMRCSTPRGRSPRPCPAGSLQLDLHEDPAQLGLPPRQRGAGVRACARAGSPAACPGVEQPMAAARSGLAQRNRCITARAASISCSDTRPSALGDVPHHLERGRGRSRLSGRIDARRRGTRSRGRRRMPGVAPAHGRTGGPAPGRRGRRATAADEQPRITPMSLPYQPSSMLRKVRGPSRESLHWAVG